MWAKKTYEVHGGWSIEEKNGSHFFQLKDDFQTSAGPDLKLYLVKKPIEDVGNRESIDQDGAEYLGELESNTGAQEYEIPSTVNLDEIHSIAIHCKAYSVVWGGVNIK